MESELNIDLVLHNGNIITMDGLKPRAQAMAVAGGRVAVVGTNEEILDLVGHSTRRLDLKGKTVLPGLQDTHLHLQDSGHYNGSMADLTGCRTIDDLKARISQHAARTPDGWLKGVGFYTGVFSEANLDASVLDEVTGDRPCIIMASDLHSACMNSAGMRAAGVDAATQDPPNGRFSRWASGVPTGLLHEEAIAYVQKRLPPTTDAEYSRGVAFGQDHALRHGITGVIDAWVTDRHCRVYHAMAQAGALKIRVSGSAKVDPDEDAAAAVERLVEMRNRYHSDYFRMHSAKFFLDGVFENRTAAMIDGYADAGGGNAPLMFEAAQVLELFRAFDAERFQIHVHVIGDLAARAALDGLEYARKANGAWPSLHQLAHLQCIRSEDIPRLGRLGCVANIQTLWARHAPSVDDVAIPMVGPELANNLYPFRSILDGGSHWALSSDWGVSTLNPFEIMETAVTRQPPGKPGHPVFMREERLSREEAIMGYTTNAAAAAWRPHTGRLARNMSADFIVVDQDISSCDPYAIGTTQVLSTHVEGREVYRSATTDI